MQLASRVALVTGAGSGIGRATAILLANRVPWSARSGNPPAS